MQVPSGSLSQSWNYTNIPPEIKSIIFSYSDLKTQIAISKVCSSWRQVVLDTTADYGKIYPLLKNAQNALNNALKRKFVPRQIMFMYVHNFILAQEVRVEQLEIDTYETMNERARRLVRDVQVLQNTLIQSIHREITAKFAIVYKKGRFLMQFNDPQPVQRPRKVNILAIIDFDEGMTHLDSMFRAVLSNFLVYGS